MNFQKTLLMSAAVVAMTAAFAMPAIATSQTVTSKTSTVNPDGSVEYQTHSVTTKEGAPVVVAPTATTTTTVVTTEPGVVVAGTPATVTTTYAPVTFYYLDPKASRIVSTGDLSQNVFDLWDEDSNDIIDMNEFYRNKMVMYEPVEYSKRTYQDINGDGTLELTQDEYTVRMQKLPLYTSLNTDNKAGISLYEFLGTGFQSVDKDDSNNLSFLEFRDAFYGQKNLTAGIGHYNGSKAAQ